MCRNAHMEWCLFLLWLLCFILDFLSFFFSCPHEGSTVRNLTSETHPWVSLCCIFINVLMDLGVFWGLFWFFCYVFESLKHTFLILLHEMV